MTWSEVIGQTEAKERLLQMTREGRVPHAMMLCGPAGCGKLALAVAMGCHLLRNGMEGTNSANTEAMLQNLSHPDLHFTFPTIKSPGMGSEHQPVSDDYIREWHDLLTRSAYFSIDQWLDAMGATSQQAIITGAESDELSRKLSLKSSQGGYKVSIIWLPERMNLTSANKLLKLLEEPPRQTVFIMVCEEPELLLETIRSRTQRIDIKKIDTSDIEQALKEQRGIDADAAHRIARAANGNWLKALDELDAGNENHAFFDMFVMLMRLAYKRDIHDLKKWSENVAGFGREKQKRMLNYFIRLIRENFIYNFQNAELNYMTQEEEAFARNFARFVNEANVVEISELLQRCQRDIAQNANAKIVFFDLALKMIVLLIQK